MQREMWKTAWIVGASAGIGRALAGALAAAGVRRVCVSARSEDKLAALAGEHAAITPYPLDATDAGALRKTASRIEQETGPLDLAVFNAGAYSPMGLGEWDRDEIERILRVNYMGAVNGLDAVMPSMRARGRGHIAVTASVAGYRGLPGALSYGPTKAALINLCETLRNDLKDDGVFLQVINPGFVRTSLTDRNDFKMPQLIEPEEAAREILKGLRTAKFEIAFPHPFVWQVMALRLLPYGLYFRLIRSLTGR